MQPTCRLANWNDRDARTAVAAAILATQVIVTASIRLELDGGSAAQDAHADTSGQDAGAEGLSWRFVRIRYHAWPELERSYLRNYWSAPWAIDAPAAEQNLSRRVQSATAITVADPIVLSLEDPELWLHPWIYFVEPGAMQLADADVPILRQFLLRGGTAVFDDFHGPLEWANLELQLKRVFPDRPIVEVGRTHPVFSSFYKIAQYPQVPGLGSFLSGRTWEKGGYIAHLRAIEDDDGRAMVLINWNTDIGDGLEWSNAEQFPGYLNHTATAYRIMINEIVYSLTH